MEPLYIILIILGGLILLTLAAAFVCFLMVFYSPARKPVAYDQYDIPEGEIYEEFREDMVSWQKALRAMECEAVEIRSRDGLPRLRLTRLHFTENITNTRRARPLR